MAVDKTEKMVAMRKKQSEKLATEVKLLLNTISKNDVLIKKSKIAEALHERKKEETNNQE